MKQNRIVSFLLAFTGACILWPIHSQNKQELFDHAREYFPEAMADYREFLSLPNNGGIREHREMNLEWCRKRLEKLGFSTTVLAADSIPHLLAEKKGSPGAKTILFYMQIDGQPVDTSAWHQPSPYKPVLKEKQESQWEIVAWDRLDGGFDPELRVFARSASDSKGPSMCLISALQILENQQRPSPYNIKLLLDFQEELSSPTLPGLVRAKPEAFKADAMIVMDGTRHVSNLPTLAYGGRGIADVRLVVYGASRNLHSGQYGNFAPNPVFKLARLLGGMKDEQGRVTIPGFYDGVTITDEDREAFARVPEDQEEIENSLGIAEAEKVGASYQESMQYPSLNVRGLRAAWVGEEVRTIIPSEAIAEMDIRLVPETDGMRQVQLLRNYIADQGFHLLDSLPTPREREQYPNLLQFSYELGSEPFRTDMQSELGDWLRKGMERVFDSRYVELKLNGGSQPIAPFITTLNLPAVSVRIPNPDNNIHAPNENMRLGNFMEGIVTCLSLLTQPF